MNKITKNKPKIIVIIPTHNDQDIISETIKKVYYYLNQSNLNFELIIVENGSKDKTKEICRALSHSFKKIKFFYLKEKGRGRALRYVFNNIDADVYCYMDSDLSTKLYCLKKLIKCAEKYDLVIGNRYIKMSKTERFTIRLILSKVYNTLVKIMFSTRFSDFQCGFKAINKKIIKEILNSVKDNFWFFDTELIILTKKRGFTVFELPIEWTENKKTKVNIFKDIIYFIFSLITFKKRMLDKKIV